VCVVFDLVLEVLESDLSCDVDFLEGRHQPSPIRRTLTPQTSVPDADRQGPRAAVAVLLR
jgi:hypothetical protein